MGKRTQSVYGKLHQTEVFRHVFDTCFRFKRVHKYFVIERFHLTKNGADHMLLSGKTLASLLAHGGLYAGVQSRAV